jgi:hypothetical protein
MMNVKDSIKKLNKIKCAPQTDRRQQRRWRRKGSGTRTIPSANNPSCSQNMKSVLQGTEKIVHCSEWRYVSEKLKIDCTQ